MHGSSGPRGLLVHLMAGAALGAVAVLLAWILSGGRPFGEVVGTADVREPTAAAVEARDGRERPAAPAGAQSRLESEPPSLAAGRKGEATAKPGKATGGGDAIRFRKPEAERPAKALRGAGERRSRARRRAVVRVVAPPVETQAVEDAPVAAAPSPAATAAPAPAATPAPVKRPKPRAPTYVAGAGEG